MQTSIDSFESSNKPSEDIQPSSELIQDLNKLFKIKKPSKSIAKNRLFRKKSEGTDDFKENEATAEAIEVEIKRDELHELLELRKLTNRKQRGLDAAQLGKGDPKQLKSTDVQEAKIIEEIPKSKKGMMESFTKQTNVMDIDKHMTDYIESQIEKLKNGTVLQADLDEREALDESLPEHLRLKNIRGNEGDVILSSAMLTAIPEVDLGIE
ncbi:hypothetical protein DSO57_1035082 [Entomophthora muscae]|nr:hypothetical protein DSO57_1035082 [Entomophthora muscae]